MKRPKLNDRQATILGLNFLIVIGEFLGIALRVSILGALGLEYYTIISNLLSLVASALVVYFLFRTNKIPHWVAVLRLIATTMLAITFIFVLFVLPINMHVPLWQLLFPGQMFFLHFACPVLAIVAMLSAEQYKFLKRDRKVVAIPTLAYAVIIIALNSLDIVNGPYPFIRQLLAGQFTGVLAAFAMCYLVPVLIASAFYGVQGYRIKKLDLKTKKKEATRNGLHGA